MLIAADELLARMRVRDRAANAMEVPGDVVLPEGFFHVLDAEPETRELWDGVRQPLSNDADLLRVLKRHRFSKDEIRNILLRFPFGAHGQNGDREAFVDELLNEGAGHQPIAQNAKQQPVPFSLPIGQFLAKPAEEVDWAVKGIFAAGCNGWIAGEPKTLKTFLAILCWLCIGCGFRFLDRFEVPRRRRALFIEEEDSELRIVRRARRLITGHRLTLPPNADDYLRLAVRAGFRLDKKFWTDSLAEEIALHKPEIVFIDVFNKIHCRDENSQAEMAGLLDCLEQLRRRFGVGFIVLHHFRKSSLGGSKRGNQSLRGSSTLGGWAENSLYLRTGSKPGQIHIESEMKDGSGADEFVVDIADTDDGGTALHYAGADLQASRVQEILAKVTAALTSLGRAATATEVSRATGLSKNSTRTYLEMLLELSTVRCSKGEKPYRWALSAQREKTGFEQPRESAEE